MSTEQNAFTPPTAPAQASTQSPAPRGPSSGRTWITIALAVIGGFALVGTGASAAIAAAVNMSGSGTHSVRSVDVTGVTRIDLDASASEVRVLFGDVDEAELEVSEGREWTIERKGDELVVNSPDSWFGWSFGGWFSDVQTVELTLPEELEGTAASFSLGAGSLEVIGDFGDMEVDVGAGDLTIDGSADTFGVDIGAGSAEILLDGVSTAELLVSAGDLSVEFTGTAPREIVIDTSAGTTDVTVPDVRYDVSEETSAGSIDNRLDQGSDARNTIDVTVSAGSVTLRPAS
jgi:hypothetical protein